MTRSYRIIFLCLLALLHRLQVTEVSRQQLEQELSIANKDKAEVVEQFQHVNIQLLRELYFQQAYPFI